MSTYLKKIKGVFFEETTITLGTGHTQKTQRVKNFCSAEQLDEETIEISFLGNEGQPTGIVVKIAYNEFLSKYTFEPDFKVKTKEEREHDKHLSRAEKHRVRNELNSAEWEYTSALKVDPESIRANFGIGTLYMEMGQTEKAKSVFKKLSQVEAIFEEENKHIFNEFGIELRKASMAEEALDNYLKALEISPTDENLYFNVARLYFDAKDLEYALIWIVKSVAANPMFREAKQFENLIRREITEADSPRSRTSEKEEKGAPHGSTLPRIHPDSIKKMKEASDEGEETGDEDTAPEKPLDSDESKPASVKAQNRD